MKKLVIVMLCLFTAASLKAQTESGNIFVGGGFGINNNKTETVDGNATVGYNRSTTISVRPQVGFFIADNFAIGASVVYSNNVNENIDEDLNKNNDLQFSPFARYYIPMTEQFSIYGQGAFGIGFRNSEIVVNNTTTDTGDGLITSFGLSGGLAFFPTEKINVNLGLNILSFSAVNTSIPNSNVENTNTNFNFGIDTFSPFLSLNYFF